MLVEINLSQVAPIDFGATGAGEIIQNIRTLLTTMQYSVPYNRGLGLAGEFLDKPLPVARALVIAEIFELIQVNEPRAEVVEVLFSDADTNEGKLIPIVRVEINGEL